ncbi:hypothetical protein Tco_0373768 [Tanacetum coccineum]
MGRFGAGENGRDGGECLVGEGLAMAVDLMVVRGREALRAVVEVEEWAGDGGGGWQCAGDDIIARMDNIEIVHELVLSLRSVTSIITPNVPSLPIISRASTMERMKGNITVTSIAARKQVALILGNVGDSRAILSTRDDLFSMKLQLKVQPENYSLQTFVMELDELSCMETLLRNVWRIMVLIDRHGVMYCGTWNMPFSFRKQECKCSNCGPYRCTSNRAGIGSSNVDGSLSETRANQVGTWHDIQHGYHVCVSCYVIIYVTVINKSFYNDPVLPSYPELCRAC